MTFQEAEAKLNGRASKRLTTHTYLERSGLDHISVRYHSTNVVMIHRDGRYTLNSGGWRTVTTKRRMNQFTIFKVFQRKHTWLVQMPEKDVEFFDGITLKS